MGQFSFHSLFLNKSIQYSRVFFRIFSLLFQVLVSTVCFVVSVYHS